MISKQARLWNSLCRYFNKQLEGFLCVKEFPKFCPLEFPSENSKRVCISRKDREIPDFLTTFGEMSDEEFHQTLVMSDMINSKKCSDEVFPKELRYKYTPLETFGLIGDTRHELDSLNEGIQSASNLGSIDLFKLYESLESGRDKSTSKVLESPYYDFCSFIGHEIQNESGIELMLEITDCDSEAKDWQPFSESGVESYYDCESDLESDCNIDLNEDDYFSAEESLEVHLGYPAESSESLRELEISSRRELLSCFVGQEQTVSSHEWSHVDFDKEDLLHVLLDPLEEMSKKDVDFLKNSSEFWSIKDPENLIDRGTEEDENPEQGVCSHSRLDNENRVSYGSKIDETYIREHKVVVPTIAEEAVEINTTDFKESDHSLTFSEPLSSEKIYDQKDVYAEMLFSHEDIEDQDVSESLWSILTETIQYVVPEIDSSCREFTTKLSETPYTQDPKYLYFNADHMNEPTKHSNYKTQEQSQSDYKQNLFSADKYNKPNKIDQYYELDERYSDLNVETIAEYHPDKTVSTTYLWKASKSEKPLSVITHDSWFSEGRFPITINSEAKGYLMDGTPLRVKTLIDSGASKPILSTSFYDKNKFLHTYPKYKIKSRPLMLGNGSTMTIDECITIVVNFGGHIFEVTCFLAPIMDDYDFIIGQKSMYELEGGPNFGNLTFHFMMRSVDIVSRDELCIKKGEKGRLFLKMKEAPPGFKHGRGILKLKTSREDKLPQTILVDIRNKKIEIVAHNIRDEDWYIKKGEVVGSLDMRSLGYFHIARDTLQTVLGDHCDFLDDEETEEFFHLVIKEHAELLSFVREQVNTKLIGRDKTQSKDDTNKPDEKDPWPWLDKDDPRRNND